jgi:hypothetical protein
LTFSRIGVDGGQDGLFFMLAPVGDGFCLEFHQGLVGADEGAGELRLVAVEKTERAGLVGEIFESQGGAGAVCLSVDGCGELFDLVIQAGAFEFPDAMQTPAAHDHGFDMMRFGLRAGMELGVEARGEGGEMFGRLAGDDDGFGEQAVLEGIGRGDGFAFGRDRPA